MSTGLRTTFWLHALVAAVFGIAYLFFPAFVTDFFGFEPADPFVMQLFGAATLGLALSSVLAALAKSLDQVEIVLRMEVGYTILSLLVCLYVLFFAGAPTLLWLGAAIFAVFAVAFGYYAWQTRAVVRTEPGTPALR
jgi:hypothetical protein